MSKKCHNCGTMLDDDALFCAECGTKQKPQEKKCPHCGAAVKEGDKFCMNCGTPVGKASSAHTIRPQKQEAADFEVSQSDENTLSIIIRGIPFNLKFIKGGMIGNIEVSDFYLGETVVTQALWQTLMGDNPSKDNSDLQYPVTGITKQLANSFLIRLKKITGLEFSLPTGSQFKYVALNGCNNEQAFEEMHWGDGKYGYAKLHRVCGMMPNQLGLHDISNWCQIVADNVPDKDQYYRFNPSSTEGEYFVCYKAVDRVVFLDSSTMDSTAAVRALISNLLDSHDKNNASSSHTEGDAGDIPKTIRVALNIPVDAEIEQFKRRQEELARQTYEESTLRFKICRHRQYGYIDREGKTVIPCIYDFAGDFYEGLAKVKTKGKYGFIDITGEQVTACKFDKAGDFHEGFAWVKLNGVTNYINNKGRVAFKLEDDDCDWPDDFSEGLVTAIVDDKLCFVNTRGKIIINCDDYEELFDFSEGRAIVKKDGGFGFIDKKGNKITPCKYSDVKDFCEGLAAVKENGKYGFVDRTGKMVIPCKYDDVDDFEDDLAKVEINKKWGYVDKTGLQVIPCIYNKAFPFYEGLACVEVKGKYGFINKASEEVIPCKYDYEDGDIDPGFCEGMARMQLKEKWGFIDKTGKIVIPFKYDKAWDFQDGLAMVEIKNQSGYLDKNGCKLGFESK